MTKKAAQPTQITFLQAGEAVRGVRYLNWALNAVYEATGEAVDGHDGALLHLFTCYHQDGDAMQGTKLASYYPLRMDPDGVAACMARHEAKARLLAARSGIKTKGVVEVDESTGEERRLIKERRPRAALDAATGCTVGTSAHSVGLILLRQRPDKFDRTKAIEAIIKECGMDKGLASSWVSTLVRRKPAFAKYGR